MFPLLMKCTGWIDLAFDTGLVVCLRDEREEVSSEVSLSLQVAAEGVQFLFLASQIQKEHSIKDFLIVFLIRVLLKLSFLKEHKTDLCVGKQNPLLLMSTSNKLSTETDFFWLKQDKCSVKRKTTTKTIITTTKVKLPSPLTPVLIIKFKSNKSQNK